MYSTCCVGYAGPDQREKMLKVLVQSFVCNNIDNSEDAIRKTFKRSIAIKVALALLNYFILLSFTSRGRQTSSNRNFCAMQN